MPFSQGAQNVRVDDGHILRASLPNQEGQLVDAEIDLNSCLGNNGGRFQWGDRDFSGSVQEQSFQVEGGASVPVLRAQLADGNGGLIPGDVNLDERINNNNGQFEFA